MQKMRPSSDSCGLRSISNPGSRGGRARAGGDAVCITSAPCKHRLLYSESWCFTWEAALPSISSYPAICSLNFPRFVWKHPRNFRAETLTLLFQESLGDVAAKRR